VTNPNPDAPKDYKELELTGGLRLDDQLYHYYDDLDIRKQGVKLDRVTGILNFSFSHHKILPRGPEDIVVHQEAQ